MLCLCVSLCQRESFSFYFFNFNTINEGLSLGVLFFSVPAFFVPVERILEPPASSLPLLLRSSREGQDLKEDCVTIVIKIMAPPHHPPLPSESTEHVKGSTFVLKGQLFKGG